MKRHGGITRVPLAAPGGRIVFGGSPGLHLIHAVYPAAVVAPRAAWLWPWVLRVFALLARCWRALWRRR